MRGSEMACDLAAGVSPRGDTCVQGCSSYHFSFSLPSGRLLNLLGLPGIQPISSLIFSDHLMLSYPMNWSILDHWFLLSRYFWPRIRKGKDGYNWTSKYWWVSSLKLAVRWTVSLTMLSSWRVVLIITDCTGSKELVQCTILGTASWYALFEELNRNNRSA
jgi:hypothetical protein